MFFPLFLPITYEPKVFFSIFAVTAVSNGLLAWKILEELTNHIDLVLSEVVMPCLSGIGLLCKIMNHKTRKNIPVISEYISLFVPLVFKTMHFYNYFYLQLILLTATPGVFCVQ